MDIQAIAQEKKHWDEPAECPLYDKNGEPEVDSKGQPVVFLVVGEYSAAAKRVARLQQKKISTLVRRYGAFENIPQSEFDAMRLEKLAAVVAGWRGVESGGQPFPHSSENAAAVVKGLEAHRPDQLKQIESAYQGHAAFFKAS